LPATGSFVIVGAVKFASLAPAAQRPVAQYSLSFAALVAAVVLRWALDPVLGDTVPFVTLFGAVAAAVWLGGLGTALAVTVAGYVAVHVLFIPPRGQLALPTVADATGLAAYLFTCALIIAIGQTMRVARARATQSRELLQVTLHSIGDAVITTDVGGKITYMNPVAEALTGWKEGEVRGHPLEAVFHIVNETSRTPVENPAHRALREGVVVGLANHTMLIRRDGSECPIDDSAAPIRDELERVSGCVLIFRDVTAQRQAEHDRQEQLLTARRLASIVDSSEVPIISKGLDGVIQSWNAAAERLFGHTAEQAIGRHISLVIPPDRLHEEDTIIATLKAGRRIEHFATERICADGRRVSVSLTVSPVKDDAGNVIGASKMVRDITREREAEESLRRLAAELADSDKRKDEFLATLAHELRGPLAPLGNVLEIWKRSQNVTELETARSTMQRQLNQLVRLVDDLLDLNRITRNRLELRKERVELAAIVTHALETTSPLLKAADHELIVTLPPVPVVLQADAARLAQVFANLLSNSCKYTHRGGTISLTAEYQAETVVVSVKDNGIGIPADKLARVFDMFAQLDTSLAQAQGGLGIGLTLVRQLVAMHGGTVEARSAGLGQGSEFLVRLPIEAAAAAAAAAAPAGELRATQSFRILVVDDNADAAVSLSTLLELEGHESIAVHDGTAALEAAEKHQPHVVLLDIGLPRMNGHEVCRRLRALPGGNDIVVVALTGWGQEEDRRKSREAGFDAHLVKPVHYAALASVLESLTPAGRA
jgi:PAS domain S-box-containing protein